MKPYKITFGLLLLCFETLAGDSVSKRVEGLLVPPPNGMIEVSDYSPTFTKIASAGLDPGQTPIGVYYLLNEFPKVVDHTLPVASRFAMGKVMLSYASERLAKDGFKTEMKLADKDMTEFKYSAKDTAAAIDQGRKDIHGIPGLNRIDAKGMTVIEKSLSGGAVENFAYIIAFANMTFPVAGKDTEITTVYCCGWVRVKSKIIQITFTMPLKDEKSVAAGRQSLTDWAKTIEKAN